MHSPAQSSKPELESLVTRAADQYMDDLKRGKAPSIEGYAKKYPAIGDVIREVFPALLVLEDIPASDTPRPDLSAAVARSADAEISAPRELGDFRLLREIGRGGMGVVYEAEQLSLGRRVALKVLPFAAMLDQQQLTRFKNEARAAATLDHPHIVSIHSVGTDRGVHYYAMQLVEGGNLAQLLSPNTEAATLDFATLASQAASDSSPQSPAKADADTRAVHSSPSGTLPDFSSSGYYQTIARLGIQAASALDHAHAAGILHRDIKPANLLIDSSGKLLIADFGLARIETDAALTATGDMVGTLRYMSPEQLQGDLAVVDHRSDIYSLGATLYELATRQPLYKGTDRARLMADIERGEPVPPRKINRRIPVDLETIILKAIERNPADRYAAAQAFADDLQRFLASQPIKARPASLMQQATKWSRRHRTATLVSSVVAVLLLMFGSAVAADRWRQVREGTAVVNDSLQAAYLALASRDVEQAQQRISDAQTYLSASRLHSTDAARRAAKLQQEIERHRGFLALLQEAHLHSHEDAGLIAADRALSVYKVRESPDWIMELRALQLPEKHVEVVLQANYELLLINADHLTRYRHKATPENTRKAREYLEKARSFHPPSRGYYWTLANCNDSDGYTARARELRRVALQTPPDHATELLFINRDRLTGYVSAHDGHPFHPDEDSIRDHRDMLRLDAQYFTGLYFMAIRLQEAYRYEEALVAWYGCSTLRPDEPDILRSRGACHLRLGQAAEAIADFERLLALHPQYAATSPHAPHVLNQLAWMLATLREDDLRNGPRAVDLATQVCELTDYTNPSYLDTLGAACAENDDYESAVSWAEKAVALAHSETARQEFKRHLNCFSGGNPWREAVERQDSPRIWIAAAEHLEKSGELKAAARLYSDAYDRIPVENPWREGRGRFSQFDLQAVDSEEMYNLLCELRPDDLSLHIARYRYLASHERWSAIPPLLERIRQFGHHRWHEGAALAVYLGDLEFHRKLCREQLERLKDTDDPYTAERLAQACCLVPDPPELDLVQQLAERGVRLGKNNGWFPQAAALAYYRAGKFAQAVTSADVSLAAPTRTRCHAATHVIKAMALHQLGRADEAYEAWQQANRCTGRTKPPFNGTFDNYWAEWLRLLILRREAEPLFSSLP